MSSWQNYCIPFQIYINMGRLVFHALFLFIGISTSTFFSPLKMVDFRGFHLVLYWWKKSSITLGYWNPVNHGMFTIYQLVLRISQRPIHSAGELPTNRKYVITLAINGRFVGVFTKNRVNSPTFELGTTKDQWLSPRIVPRTRTRARSLRWLSTSCVDFSWTIYDDIRCNGELMMLMGLQWWFPGIEP